VLAAAIVACQGETPSPRADSAPAAAPVAYESPAAPDSFRVLFETNKGDFVVRVNRALSPKGADRFHDLVTSGYFTDVRFFRVIPGFVAQFGMNGDPAVNARWSDRNIPDEPVRQPNTRGTLTFATSGPNTRSNQLFINYGDNRRLDASGFTPFGEVVEGMAVVDSLFSGYGGNLNQTAIAAEGNEYLKREFPNLDYIEKATIVTPTGR
jgi:peptidyl-prolyl cis-trans isomerase A (cyclophilin A)